MGHIKVCLHADDVYDNCYNTDVFVNLYSLNLFPLKDKQSKCFTNQHKEKSMKKYNLLKKITKNQHLVKPTM